MREKRRKRKQKRGNLLLFLTLAILIGIGFFLSKEGESDKKLPKEQKSTQSEGQTENTDQLLKVHFIDVGQGDATLITCGEHAMLIDAGNNTMGTAIQLYLKKQGIERLDYLIGTHPDADHIGGLDVIITKFDCDMVMMPEVTRDNATYRDVVMAMEYRGYQNTPPVVGTKYQLGEAVFTIVAPVKDYGEEYNNYSIGILLEYGKNSFLFVGDAEEAAENDMLSTGIDLKADVLKVGHHGSSDSTKEAFLDAVDPSYAVISCGAENEYGHPHKRTLNSLRKRAVEIYRTDERGNVVAVSDGEKVMFETEK